MKVDVIDTLTEADLDGDLTGRARSLANDRKILRLLDGAARLPFVAVLTMLARRPEIDPTELALYLVSDSDYRPPAPEGGDRSPEAVARSYYEHANPAAWLAGMPNSAICQASIVGQVHGPNLHVVGGAEAAWHAACIACRALDRRIATAAMVVGYRPTPPDAADPGLVSVVAFGPDSSGRGLDLALPAPERLRSMAAVELVRAWVDEARSASPDLATAVDR
jgi:hypothetical protein